MNRMRYRCDACGCYLDPGEGRLCDECRDAEKKRSEKARRIGGMIHLSDLGQYEMIEEEMRWTS